MIAKMMIMRGSASVEASIMTKDLAVKAISLQTGYSFAEMAVVGDDLNDIPMLTLEGIALAGAPSNANHKVRAVLNSQPNGYVSDFEVCDGFFDIYRHATDLGVKVLVTDRDGVLKSGSRVHWGSEFGELAKKMGGSLPYVFVVTSSSKTQNDKFREEYCLDERLAVNLHVRNNPWLLFAEGGAVQVNVLTGNIRNYARQLSPELIEKMKGPFESAVKDIIDSNLPLFGLTWTQDYDNQNGMVYHVTDKIAMVCFNVPRTFRNCATTYRTSPESEAYRDMVTQAMIETAERLNIPYDFF